MLDNPYLRETLRAVLPPELSFISGIIIVIIIIIIVITIVIIIIIVIIVIMVTNNYNYINIFMIIKQFIHLTLGKRKHHCPRDPPEVRSFDFILDFCFIFLIWIWI